MYSLLVVDDMPIVADGLTELLRGASHLNLKLYKTYSGLKALEMLKSNKIDIVLSDMKMPGMEGIELLKHIRAEELNCKVIFLTAYNDFNNVRDAISFGGFEFILKTEGDDKIIRTVEKAIHSLNEEAATKNLIHQTVRQMNDNVLSSRHEHIWDLLSGQTGAQDSIKTQFELLRVPFRPELPFLLVMGRIDSQSRAGTTSDPGLKPSANPDGDPDRHALFHAIAQIAEQYLADCVKRIALGYSQSQLLMLFQPEKREEGDERELAARWNEHIAFIHGKLASMRHTCRKLLDLQVSFAVHAVPADWPELPASFGELQAELEREANLPSEPPAAAQDSREERREPVKEGGASHFQLHKIQSLEMYLENGDKAEFYKLFAELEEVIQDQSIVHLHKLEYFHALYSVFESSVAACQLTDEWAKLQQMDQQIQFGERIVWRKVISGFEQIAAAIFEYKINVSSHNKYELINKIHEYIETHLADNLTLPTLAAHVNLNPSYFSRFYKQMTGIGLSDYITEIRNARAKQLLRQKHLKIWEIAEETGYNSSLAFIRFFKKHNQMTPQEFRKMYLFK
ncbi:response regulator [Paenibacillus sp. GCM10027626]|uniref:response regulator n=1 Tax=Paenibacillus sp. GCM10027626 TaxID=3273411 RepID=UPI0036276FAD